MASAFGLVVRGSWFVVRRPQVATVLWTVPAGTVLLRRPALNDGDNADRNGPLDRM